MKRILLFIFSVLFFLRLNAQQQWKFHLAFEDATGAKDTIWMIWDTTATGPWTPDTLLGEGAVSFDYSVFNVWIYNYQNDSTKTCAFPYVYYPSHEVEVRAFNYQYPISVSWDTALFHAQYLPYIQGVINIARIDNDYFFGNNNDPPLQAFNMLLDNHVVAPYFNFGSQTHFPMTFTFYDGGVGVAKYFENGKDYTAYPNPFSEAINISAKEKIKSIELFSSDGSSKYSKYFEKPIILNNYIVKVTDLPIGLYYLKIVNHQNHTFYEKQIKTY